MHNNLLRNDEVVQALSRSLARGIDGLGNAPRLIVSILETSAWKDRHLAVTGEEVHFETFADFVNATVPAGLGVTVADLERVCRDDVQALSMLDQALKRRRGRPAPGEPECRPDTIEVQATPQSKAPTGNSRRAALRRLEDQRPDLFDKVLKGEISAHKAAVLAGFRTETFTMVHDVAQIERTLRQRLSLAELQDLIQRLTANCRTS